MTEFYELTAERPSLGAQSRLIGDDRQLARAGMILLAVLTVWRLYMATITSVIWDEAHFVMSGQHVDLAYPDIPAGYPWLARLITSLFGWQVLPLRLVAIVMATLIPFAVYFMARPVVDRRQATWAAIASLLCPAIAQNGVIFYPEGGLQLLLALMAGCLLRAVGGNKMKWWIATGVFAGLGLLVHYRFIVPGLPVVGFLIATPVGRKQWTRPGLYVTAGLALVGLLPAVIYNMVNHWPAVQFHIVNRPKLEISLTSLVSMVMTQVMMANPVLFLGFAVGAKRAVWDRRDQPEALLGWMGAGVFVFYCLQSIINKKIMPHWPWLAFIPLLPLAPAVLIGFVDQTASRVNRMFRMVLVGLAPVIVVVAGGVFSFMQYVNAHALTMPYSLRGLDTSKHENWALIEPELATAVAAAKSRFGDDIALATNGHASAVHIEFPAEKGRRVYTLDDPDDVKTRFV
ncbi:MAG: glycosyltransferase family 39 protein, partial [Asticcacaulis sp.]|nr:glycosyltransferase family 39 protein [Asticcacaulis sp.]